MVSQNNKKSLPIDVYLTYIVVYFQNHSGVSAKCRDTRVEELWGLTSFFGYSTQTFVQAVNFLDRFLTVMKVGI